MKFLLKLPEALLGDLKPHSPSIPNPLSFKQDLKEIFCLCRCRGLSGEELGDGNPAGADAGDKFGVAD